MFRIKEIHKGLIDNKMLGVSNFYGQIGFPSKSSYARMPKFQIDLIGLRLYLED